MKKITSTVLGKEITKRCGNEGKHRDLNKTGQTTLRYLQTAISYLPDAIETGADLTNAAFIFAQPGREFVMKSGKGDWEFYFSEDANDKILGRCVREGRKPVLSTFWNDCKKSFAWFSFKLFEDSDETISLPALTQHKMNKG